jgi:CRISPR-associated protein (TIGR02710 family)
MAKILLITVGGSHQPIVTAIRELQPERVVFICSDGAKGSKSQVIGSGTPCEVRRGTEVIEKLPNIPTQVGLGDKFQPDRDLILIEEPDDLSECYLKASLCIQKIQETVTDAQMMADYTGGTKSMSVGLAMASVDYQITLYVTTAVRTNIIKVERGELTGQATVAPIVAQRTIEQFLPILLQQYNYPAAIAQLRRLLSSMTLPPEVRRQIQTLYACCSGLDAWDRFEHREALEFLETQMRNPVIRNLVIFLKKVINSRGQIDENFDSTSGTEGHGYEIVQDLILNAERRAEQQRYDDAVGRLYRSLELLAQIRLLKAYGIKTGDINVEKLPENLRSEYEKKRSPNRSKIQIALRSSYELLTKLPGDPIGKIYLENANRIINALEVRNNSLFAHGFKPITSTDYENVSEVFGFFIKSAISSVVINQPQIQPPQFPINLEH